MGFEEFNFLEAPRQSSIERSTQLCLIALCWPDDILAVEALQLRIRISSS